MFAPPSQPTSAVATPAARLPEAATPAGGATLPIAPNPAAISTEDEDEHEIPPTAAAEVPPSPPGPVEDLLTVIITTSPTPSAPTTDLLSQVLESFASHCPALLRCRVVVVFDTYDHIGPRARLKRGQVTAQGADDYDVYKTNVKALFLREYYRQGRGTSLGNEEEGDEELIESQGEAEFGYEGRKNGFEHAVSFRLTRTPDGLVSFVEPADRLGFGLGVRTGLRMAETPYVWVHQHDWTLLEDIPVAELLDVMSASARATAAEAPSTSPSPTPAPTSDVPDPDLDADLVDPPIKYICLPSCGTHSYAVSANVTRYKTLVRLTRELKRSFVPRSHPGSASVPLTPLFFWHDKPHLAESAHYLSRVFPTRLALGRGDFIEDTVGHRARTQMKAGSWSRWACWMYYPDEGRTLCLRHLQGRYWRGMEAERQKKEMWIALNAKRVADAEAAAAALRPGAGPVPGPGLGSEPEQEVVRCGEGDETVESDDEGGSAMMISTAVESLALDEKAAVMVR